MPLALRFEEVATWLSPDWPSLADRTGLPLDVTPEHPAGGGDDSQLTLF